jgi:hypothetical protein
MIFQCPSMKMPLLSPSKLCPLMLCISGLIAACGTAAAQPTSSSRLVNLSILTSLTSTGDTFTMGYVVGGAGTSGTKSLVIRATGPSLGAFGVSGTLDDPKVELFTGVNKTGENDNWGGGAALANAMAAVGAFAYTEPSSRDAAVALSVASGDNSVKVSAAGNNAGAVIAEIYDATAPGSFTATTPRLINVSVLKQLGTGVTVGFVVGGSGTKHVLVRAIGPTLGTAFGVSGAVSDPQLKIYAGQTEIGNNDNWGGTPTLVAAFSTAGAFPLADASRDAAAVVSLQPGSYTVFVSGVGNTSGLALVEVYELATAPASVFHVAPNGNDVWSGRFAQPNVDRTDGPLATLTGARNAVRKLKTLRPLTEPVRIIVANGVYPMNETLVLTPADSGTAACPISYEAETGAAPRFFGGRSITGFTRGSDGVWTTRVPEVAAGQWYFEQLWVNGRRAIRARSPNKFYYYVTDEVNLGVDPITGQIGDLTKRAFRARIEDIEPLRTVPRNRLNDVTVVAYHSWESSRSRLAGADPATGTVVVTAGIQWGFAGWGANCRYHLENFRAALDEPGEWFLDRDGTLSYIPRPEEAMTTATVSAPVLDQFVQIAGDPDNSRFVEYLTIRGLSFQYGQYLLPSTGHADNQAEVTIPAAIVADGARQVVFEDCEVKHVGTHGVWFRRGCSDCRIQRCWLDDLGAGGVMIGDTNGNLNKPQTSRIVCDNNIIHAAGRIHNGAVGVWIGHSGNNQVTHNEISDHFYSGISVGWSWGYAQTVSVQNRIEYNHIHHLGWGVLSDMGGVYTLGLAQGTTVSNNVIHDVNSYDHYGRGGWGLYTDEGSSGIVMENNLVYRTSTGSYNHHYGRENVVRNNILANSLSGQIQRSIIEEHLSFTLANNLIYWETGPLIAAGNINDDRVRFESNLYFDASGTPVSFQGLTLTQRQVKGWDLGSIVEDPRFVNPATGDFHLKPLSAASKIGFQPFDYSKAGLYGNAAWCALPEQFIYPPVEFAPLPPPPPPLEINDDFESTPIGSPPAKATVFVENRGDFIHVTDETAAGGARSLKIQDAVGVQAQYNPHLFYVPNHYAGTTRCDFDLRFESGVILGFECRSWDVFPYRVGPSLRIQDGKLSVGGRALMDVPTGRWFHVQISAKVGTSADGKWSLTITLPNSAPRVFTDLTVGSPDFKNLTWLGWSSFATDRTVYYLDNIRVKND